jgi:hypothetical protein
MAAAALMLLAGCDQDIRAYRRPVDGIYAILGLNGLFGRHICARGPSRMDGLVEVIASIPDDECYQFAPARRMAGVWLFGEEESKFWPSAGSLPKGWRKAGEDIWLDSQITPPTPTTLGETDHALSSAFAVEFIGRPALYRGRYGQWGGSQRLVLMDKLISVKPLTN